MVLTDDGQQNMENTRGVWRDLALVVALVARGGVANLQAPIIWRLEHQRKTRVADVGVQAEGNQPQLVAVPTHPWHLQQTATRKLNKKYRIMPSSRLVRVGVRMKSIKKIYFSMWSYLAAWRQPNAR